jgi:hypothetical protein
MKCMSHRCVQWESILDVTGQEALQQAGCPAPVTVAPRRRGVHSTDHRTLALLSLTDKARARHCHAMLRVHAHVLGSTRSPTRKNAECACRGLHLWCGQWTCGAVPHSQYSSRGRLDTISIRTPALSFFKKKVYPVCDSTSARPACNYCACTSTPAC